MDVQELVDYAKSLDCIHCGLCLRTCPTYRITGVESSSPRGRIHLMRALAEGEIPPDSQYAEELDFCLVCRHCESVCPSGVQFGAMMEVARNGIERARPRSFAARLARRLGFGFVLQRRFALSTAAALLRLAQRTGLLQLAAKWFGVRGRALASLPEVPPRHERRPLPAVTSPAAPAREAVAVLAGCVMPEWLGRVNRATVHVLAEAGHEVRTPRGHVCCGALHAHNGDLEGARELLRGTIAAFDSLTDSSGTQLPVVVNSAGCGAHLRAAGHLLEKDVAWSARATAFAGRVRDFSEYLVADGFAQRLAGRQDKRALDGPVTYDDPCHLCHGQGVRSQPRELIAAAGATRVELDDAESCCGSAGIYSMLRPADSLEVFAPKLDALRRSEARVLVTANPGCQLQWQSGVSAADLDVEVLHVAELIERALPAGSSL